MQYFKRLNQVCDPAPLLAELGGIDAIWAEQTGRQSGVPVQREALAIPLRGMVKSAQSGRPRRDVHESRWTSGSYRLPRFQEFLKQIAAEEDGVLGRAKIVSLPAGRQVYPHSDRGEYYKVRNRYHLVLKSTRGSWLKAGDEEVRMQEGELWWFDNKAVHEAKNDGQEDRIHLIFDLLPRHLETLVMRASRKARKASIDA
ncbi:aspartyl/asparaginyl beta-hydroxylase domain-containing protein [Hyphomonas sp.]|uniref:aspartyl/asparaginyl beta-hydroxylase domain-containing protein n=1 Tax=Hyphomonas sp. TaxID=87 RepID=UPI0025BEE25E|nr:aspartyl/asparaginyl beta-hydroxylase domain-containing protein [Hyphomonas sp.]